MSGLIRRSSLFVPAADLGWATAVLDGAEEAACEGRGAFVVGGAMVDAPLVERARRILALAPDRKG